MLEVGKVFAQTRLPSGPSFTKNGDAPPPTALSFSPSKSTSELFSPHRITFPGSSTASANKFCTTSSPKILAQWSAPFAHPPLSSHSPWPADVQASPTFVGSCLHAPISQASAVHGFASSQPWGHSGAAPELELAAAC